MGKALVIFQDIIRYLLQPYKLKIQCVKNAGKKPVK